MRALSIVLALLVLAPGAQAQFDLVEIPDEVATWEARIQPPRSAAGADEFGEGDAAFVVLSAEIVDGWRVYALGSPAGLPLELTLGTLPRGLSLDGAPGQTETHDGYDEGLQADYTYHEGHARVWQRVRVARGAQPGTHVVRGSLRYAACNDSVCLPPRTLDFEAPIRVRAGS